MSFFGTSRATWRPLSARFQHFACYSRAGSHPDLCNWAAVRRHNGTHESPDAHMQEVAQSHHNKWKIQKNRNIGCVACITVSINFIK